MTPWTVACQASLAMGLSRQEYWRWLPGPPPGDLSNQGIKPGSPAPEWSPALQADASLCEPAGKPKPQHPYLKIHRGHNSYNASCQETRRNYTTPLILRGCSAKGSCYDHLYSPDKQQVPGDDHHSNYIIIRDMISVTMSTFDSILWGSSRRTITANPFIKLQQSTIHLGLQDVKPPLHSYNVIVSGTALRTSLPIWRCI